MFVRDKKPKHGNNSDLKTPFFQPKLKTGKPGDVYEVEADKMADKVVDNSSVDTTVQKQGADEELQQKPLASEVTPLIQKKQGVEEEQPVQSKEEDEVQMMEEEEAVQSKEEDEVQMMEEEEAVQSKEEDEVQMMEEEEAVQSKEEDEVQMMEEEEAVQSKEINNTCVKGIQKQCNCSSCSGESAVQKKSNDHSSSTSKSFESKLNSTKGGGNGMDNRTKENMESSFGADFSGVRIHNDSEAAEMSSDIGARAFTHGNDIYFNQNQYDPNSKEGKRLLAHELTHTVQQGASLQKKEQVENKSDKKVQGSFWSWAGNLITGAVGWAWDAVTDLPKRVWRLFKHVSIDSVIGIAKWIWNGISSLGSHVWNGLTGIFNWLGDGVSGVINWIGRAVAGGATWAQQLLAGNWNAVFQGFADALGWLGDGVVGVLRWGWKGLRGLGIWLGQGVYGLGKWVFDGLLGGVGWTLKLAAKILDLFGIGEIVDFLQRLFAWGTRPLTGPERAEAQSVFGNTISYWQVRIIEHSIIAKIGAFFQGSSGMGVTIGHTINFNHPVATSPGDWNMGWLIHELAHVAQYEAAGIQYIGEALHAQATAGYNYGGGAGLVGKQLADFNREQQGDIARDAYLGVLYSTKSVTNTAEYNRMLQQFRSGNL